MKFFNTLSKEKLQQLILTSIIGVTATAAVIFFYVNKQRAAIREAETKSAGVRQQIVEAEKQNRADRQIEAQRATITEFMETQRATFVTGDALSWTVRAMGDLAQKQPVRVLGWRPAGKGTHRVNSQYEVFTMLLEVDGDYDSLGHFVEALENKFPASEIRKVDVMGPNPAEPIRRLNVEIGLPILPENQQPKAPGKPATEVAKPA